MKYILITHYAGWSQLHEASSYWDFASRGEHFNYSELSSLAEAEEWFCDEEIPEDLRDILESGKAAFQCPDGFWMEDTRENREECAKVWIESDVKDFHAFDSEEEAIEYASTHYENGIRKAILQNGFLFDVPLYGIAVEVERNGNKRLEPVDEDLTIYEAKRAVENWSGEGIPRILTEEEMRDLPDEDEEEEE
jgi:hypothetical protein